MEQIHSLFLCEHLVGTGWNEAMERHADCYGGNEEKAAGTEQAERAEDRSDPLIRAPPTGGRR
jgi:hypothetical protein